MPVMRLDSKIFVAGHRGLVGSAICRNLNLQGFHNVLTRSRSQLDLTDQAATNDFLLTESPEIVIDAAALVGGIKANSSRPAEFIGANLAIQQNLIWGSHLAGVPRLLFLGSSCVYPRDTPQPIPETALLSGPPEPTNAPYAIAKIAGLTLCSAISRQFGRDYFTVMPPNIYGPGDNFDPSSSHVMAAMIRRFHENLPGTAVTCWGSGSPKREFLFVDDAAEACVFMLRQAQVPSVVNIGTGASITIKELAERVQAVVGHTGEINWDTSQPDGFPEKTNDISVAKGLGWRPSVSLEDGVRATYEWFLGSQAR